MQVTPQVSGLSQESILVTVEERRSLNKTRGVGRVHLLIFKFAHRQKPYRGQNNKSHTRRRCVRYILKQREVEAIMYTKLVKNIKNTSNLIGK